MHGYLKHTLGRNHSARLQPANIIFLSHQTSTSHSQPAVLFSHNKSASATSHSQPAALFSHNKSASATSHSQPNIVND